MSHIDLGQITSHNLKQLKILNSVLFPIKYNDRFYEDALKVGEFAKFAWYKNLIVGTVCCRKEPNDNKTKKIYIMTLGVLEKYRGLGIGTLLLKHIINLCEKDTSLVEIFLHVQIDNQEALNFYKKFSFQQVELVKNYYVNMPTSDAYLLSLPLHNQSKSGKIS